MSICFFFSKIPKRQSIYGAICGVSLIVYGLSVVKSIGSDWLQVGYVHQIIEAMKYHGRLYLYLACL